MKKLLCVITLAALVTGGARADFHYFEKIDKSAFSDPELAASVAEVVENYPAIGAGVQAGDLIVAVNGFRIWSDSEFTAIKYVLPIREKLVLTIYRQGRLLDFNIAGLKEDLVVGVQDRDTPYDVLSHFDSMGIDIERRFGPEEAVKAPGAGKPKSQAKADAANSVLDAFGVTADYAPRAHSRLLSQSERLLQYLPRRAMGSLVRAAGKGDRESVSWVSDFVRVYTHMRFEEFSEAAALIQKDRLIEQAPDTFLSGLLGFYMALCKAPPSAESGISLDKYGVDAATFVFCYPFPVLPEKQKREPFHDDPEFQNLFNIAQYGNDAARSSAGLGSKAYHLANNPHPQWSLEDYLSMNKASLLDPDSHGGWPFRSHHVSRDGPRSRLLANLKLKWEECDQSDTLVALAMICPSIFQGDISTFEEPYRFLVNLGVRESAIANSFVFNSLNTQFTPAPPRERERCVSEETRNELLKVLKECYTEQNPPGVYRWLAAHNEHLRDVAARGFEVGNARKQYGLPYYCTTDKGSVATLRAITGVESGLIPVDF